MIQNIEDLDCFLRSYYGCPVSLQDENWDPYYFPKPLREDWDLHSRLKKGGDSFRGALAEVIVAIAFERAGVSLERNPRSKNLTPDFGVHLNGKLHLAEVMSSGPCEVLGARSKRTAEVISELNKVKSPSRVHVNGPPRVNRHGNFAGLSKAITRRLDVAFLDESQVVSSAARGVDLYAEHEGGSIHFTAFRRPQEGNLFESGFFGFYSGDQDAAAFRKRLLTKVKKYKVPFLFVCMDDANVGFEELSEAFQAEVTSYYRTGSRQSKSSDGISESDRSQRVIGMLYVRQRSDESHSLKLAVGYVPNPIVSNEFSEKLTNIFNQIAGGVDKAGLWRLTICADDLTSPTPSCGRLRDN